MLISITVIALKIHFEKHYHPEVGMCHYKEAIFVGEDVYSWYVPLQGSYFCW